MKIVHVAKQMILILHKKEMKQEGGFHANIMTSQASNAVFPTLPRGFDEVDVTQPLPSTKLFYDLIKDDNSTQSYRPVAKESLQGHLDNQLTDTNLVLLGIGRGDKRQSKASKKPGHLMLACKLTEGWFYLDPQMMRSTKNKVLAILPVVKLTNVYTNTEFATHVSVLEMPRYINKQVSIKLEPGVTPDSAAPV